MFILKKGENIVSDQISTDNISHYINHYRRRDGSIFIANLYLKTIYDEKNMPAYLEGFVEDITERKMAEEELRQSEELLNRSQEIASVGSFFWDLKDDALYWSRNMYVIHGLDGDSFAGNLTEVSIQLIHPDDRNRIRMEIQKMVEAGRVWNMEFRIIRPDGQERIMQSSGEFELDYAGKPIKCFGIHQDITEQKRTEKALIESEEKFSKAFKNAPLLMTISTFEDGRFLDVNDAFISHTGYSRDLVIGATSTEVGFAQIEDRNRMIHMLETEGRVQDLELSVQRADGSNMVCLYSSEIAEIKGQNLLLSNAIDITDRKRFENELRKSEQKYRDLVDTLPYGIEEIDLNGRAVFLNDAYHRILGYGPGELIGTYIWDHDPTPDSKIRVKDYFDFIRKEMPTPEPYISKNSRKDGAIIDVNVDWNYKYDEGGELKGFIAVVTDITDKIQSERALRQSEYRFRSFVENANDIVYTVSPEGIFTYVSPNWLEFMGEPADDAIGNSFKPYVHPEDVHLCQEFLDKVLTSGKKQRSVEYRVKHKDGSWRWHVSNGSPLRNPEDDIVGYLGIARDVTDYKQMEQALRESEAVYRSLAYNFPNGALFVFDENFRYLAAAGESLVKEGFSSEQIVNKEVKEVFPELWDTIRPHCEAALSGQKSYYEVEYRERLYSNEALPISVDHGSVKRALVVTNDITESRNFELALKESEAKYRSMMESLDEATYICSSDFRIEYMNPAMIRKVGRDATGEICFKVIHGKEEQCPWCVHERIMNGESIKSELVAADGEEIDLVSHSPIFHVNGTVSKLTVYRDITEQKKMEIRIQQAQKMESIGTLAGGIAHDFNNILWGIMGFIEMSLIEVQEGSILEENLNQALSAGNRAKELVQQILSFSRMSEQEKQLIDIQIIAKEAIKLLRASIPTSIEMKQNIAKTKTTVFADPTQIHQVIMNLCTNAAHAIEKSEGVMEIILEPVDIATPQVLTNGEIAEGPYIKLSVSDTGIGMDPVTLNKIFDPYYTTKSQGTGTGLGLAVVHGIVSAHGGGINVHSEPGKGSIFEVYIPRIDTGIVAASEKTMPLSKGNEKILFVDDEEGLVNLVTRMLGHLGYEVVATKSSNEALDLFRKQPDQFDLVISDLTMPFMTGDKLAQEMMKIRPDIPVILCSGYSKKLSEEQAREIGIRRILMKPIVLKDLSKIVRQVLDEAKS